MNLVESYSKGVKIINSCENKIQLKAARKYMDNFLRIFQKTFPEQFIQSAVYQMYAELYLAYDKKLTSIEDN